MKMLRVVLNESIQKGLKPVADMPINSGQLADSVGLYPWEGSIRSIDNISVFSLLPPLGESFPFPQVFKLRNTILVCGATTIWEYIPGGLVLKLTGLTQGTIWTIADFQNYILLCNGKQLVQRDTTTYTYTVLNDVNIPCGYSICNLNGQLIVAGPNITIPASEVV